MKSTIWNKYKIIKEVNSTSNIKTYLTFIQPIVKEIITKSKDAYDTIIEKLQDLREELNIYEIIGENDKIYVAIDNNDELLSKIDNLISEDLEIKKEGVIEGQGNPITKTEIFDLFEMEKSVCKIEFEDEKGNKGKGSGFFCEINLDIPIKYALFTNNHVLNESEIEIGNTIYFEYISKSILGEKLNKKQIKITENRKVFTNEELDYTCIELFQTDGIVDYFKIDPKIFKFDLNNLNNNDIFILQFPNGNDLSFSNGKILSIVDDIIKHNASTETGSSGSPIIRRSKGNYIIGIHYGFKKNRKYNLGTTFNSIYDDIKKKLKETKLLPNKNGNNKDNNNKYNIFEKEKNDKNKDQKETEKNDKNEDPKETEKNESEGQKETEKNDKNEDRKKTENNESEGQKETEKNDSNEDQKETEKKIDDKEILPNMNNLNIYPPNYNDNIKNELNNRYNNNLNQFNN